MILSWLRNYLLNLNSIRIFKPTLVKEKFNKAESQYYIPAALTLKKKKKNAPLYQTTITTLCHCFITSYMYVR